MGSLRSGVTHLDLYIYCMYCTCTTVLLCMYIASHQCSMHREHREHRILLALAPRFCLEERESDSPFSRDLRGRSHDACSRCTNGSSSASRRRINGIDGCGGVETSGPRVFQLSVIGSADFAGPFAVVRLNCICIASTLSIRFPCTILKHACTAQTSPRRRIPADQRSQVLSWSRQVSKSQTSSLGATNHNLSEPVYVGRQGASLLARTSSVVHLLHY
jgi:hypothetical protein